MSQTKQIEKTKETKADIKPINLKCSIQILQEKLKEFEKLTGEQAVINFEKSEKTKSESLESKAAYLEEKKKEIVRLNIGGESFATYQSTLIKIPDTLLYRVITSKKFKLENEIFFDRNPKMFGVLLDYLRNMDINYSKFSTKELEELKIEAEYYDFMDIYTYLEEYMKNIEFVNVTHSGVYNYSGILLSPNEPETIRDRDLKTGIAAQTPGWIIVELNQEWEFDTIEIGGFNGNTSYWSPTNGQNATISTSLDNVTWKTVGSVPSAFAYSITSVKLTKSVAKYIKFSNGSLMGIGFLEIKKPEI